MAAVQHPVREPRDALGSEAVNFLNDAGTPRTIYALRANYSQINHPLG